jgi:Winged helix DNA-binding domain
VHDFGWWSGLRIGDAKRGIEAVGSRFERETIDGRTFWFTGDPPALKRSPPVAHLLPNYDEYFIGHKDRSAIGQRVAASKAAIPVEAFFANVIVVGGQLVGAWKRIATPRTTTVELRLVVDVTPREERAIHAQAERYGTFLGAPVTIADAR